MKIKKAVEVIENENGTLNVELSDEIIEAMKEPMPSEEEREKVIGALLEVCNDMFKENK